jgi:hypothetical protein
MNSARVVFLIIPVVVVVIIERLKYSCLSFCAHHIFMSSVANPFYTLCVHAVAMRETSKCCKNIQLIIEYIFHSVCVHHTRDIFLFAILHISPFCSLLFSLLCVYFFMLLDGKHKRRRNRSSIPLLFSSCAHIQYVNLSALLYRPQIDSIFM